MMDRKKVTYISQVLVPYMVRSGFNAIMFNNKGTANATVNSFPLAPGESYGWAHNANEIDTAEYRIDFPGGNRGANIWITATYYND